MTKISFIDIETAFDFVNFDSYNDNSAAVNRETGEIHYIGDSVDENLPDDFYEEDESLVWIPDKRDLDLGIELAMDFCASILSRRS